jgi:hypothetical protein
MSKAIAVLGSALFFVIAPLVLAGFVLGGSRSGNFGQLFSASI